ncbi:MAG: phosphoribosyltransferase [Candidatus Helarchaeota archaeon]
MIYKTRFHAGQVLGEQLRKKSYIQNAVILAIPNGGVPVAKEISDALKIPYDILIIRKMKIPWNTEAGFGSITRDGEIILNEDLVKGTGLTKKQIEEQAAITMKEIEERIALYKPDKKFIDLTNKNVILVDDGLASGFTMIAAIRSIKKKNINKIIVAVPTASGSSVNRVRPLIDDLICPDVRTSFYFAVASAYENWYDLDEKEVLELLKKSKYYFKNIKNISS